MRIPALNRQKVVARSPMPEIVPIPVSSTYINGESEPIPETKKESRVACVIFGLVLFAIALLLAASLISFDPRDPSFTFSSSLPARNWLGIPGAYASDVSLFLFGFSSYFIVLALLASGVSLMRGKTTFWHKVGRTLALLMLLAFTGALEHLRFAFVADMLPGEAGGALGQFTASNLVLWTARAEAIVIAFIGSLVMLRLTLGFSFLKLFEVVGHAIEAFFGIFFRRRDKAFYRLPPPTPAPPSEIEVIESTPTESAPSPESRVTPIVVKPKEKLPSKNPIEQIVQTPDMFEKTYQLPDIHWLDKPVSNGPSIDRASLEIMSTLIENKLATFGVKVRVVKVRPGPVVTLYEIELAEGLKSSAVTNLGSDLARVLSVASVRILDTVAGTSHMGIEAPNPNRQIVKLVEIIDSDLYRQEQGLPLCLGKKITGEPFVVDLRKMPHLLVAGTTGSGKSVGVNAMLLSLIYRYTPDALKFLLVDPKQVEFSLYEDIPHLICPVVTDMKKASRALQWCVKEMERRYRMASMMKTRSITEYNKRIRGYLSIGKKRVSDIYPDTKWDYDLVEEPFIIVVVDELADLLMMDKKGGEDSLIRLAQKARAASIHLILATQRPSADIISGLLRTNIPSRMAFQVATASDSRIIMDASGAESLLGMGDALFKSASVGMPERVQAPFVTDGELTRITDELRKLGSPNYVEGMLEGDDEEPSAGGEGVNGGQIDPLFDRATQIVCEAGKCSITMLQRRLGVGYPRAANIVDQLEAQGVVSAPDGSGRRTVLARMEE
ncbi:MAG TPA: cell division protein FtsK [Sutterella sp.]|nr:cell division protein FtsK [Sutterella sp.]